MPKVNMETPLSSNDITVVYSANYEFIRKVDMKRAVLGAIHHNASKFVNAWTS